jgi:hypothetical protein
MNRKKLCLLSMSLLFEIGTNLFPNLSFDMNSDNNKIKNNKIYICEDDDTNEIEIPIKYKIPIK